MCLQEKYAIQARMLDQDLQRCEEGGGSRPHNVQALKARDLLVSHMRWGCGAEIVAMVLADLSDEHAAFQWTVQPLQPDFLRVRGNLECLCGSNCSAFWLHSSGSNLLPFKSRNGEISQY